MCSRVASFALVVVSISAALVVGLQRSAGATALGVLPLGWAVGGSASSPQSQVTADTSCGANSVLLFSARGSGDVYGGDLARNKVGAWAQGAGLVLIKNGWNVRDLQAIYPAPPVPSFSKIAAAVIAGGGLTGKSAAAVALITKQFRDAVSNSWRSVQSELEAAYARCPSRKILLAGYSQGAILLRYIVPRLDAKILKQVVSVDLFADPTEQRAVDSRLQHPPGPDGRLTTEGLDTLSGSVLNGGSFRQTAYPAGISGRTYQYCMDGDLVCDVNLSNLNPTNAFNEGKIHASYGFQLTGIRAGRRAGTFGSGPPSTLTSKGVGGLQLGLPLAGIESQHLIGPTRPGCDLSSPPPIVASLRPPLAGFATFKGVAPYRLEALSVTAGARTDRGIAIGDPEAKVLRAYPAATVQDADPSDPLQIHAVVVTANNHSVLWFMLNKGDRHVRSIEVPGPQFCE